MCLTMEQELNYSILKNKLFIILLIIFGAVSFLRAQDSYNVKDTFDIIGAFHVMDDPKGNFYIENDRGELIKYDSTFKVIASFTGDAYPSSSFFVKEGFKILQYYRLQQEYYILDRFLRITTQGSLRNEPISAGAAITLSFDNKLWVVDDQENALHKIDNIQHFKEFPTALPANDYSTIIALQEHQNKLYLVFPQKVMIFDLMGNLLQTKSIDAGELRDVQFFKDQLFVLGESLVSYGIYDNQKTILKTDVPLEHARCFEINDEFLYLFEKGRMLKLAKK